MQIPEVNFLPEGRIVPDILIKAGFDEVMPVGFDYKFEKGGYWSQAKESAGYILNLDYVTYKTAAPSLLVRIPPATEIPVNAKAGWLLGVYHQHPNSNIYLDFWHRDTRSAGLNIWEKGIYFWRYDQALWTTAWAVDAGSDGANTWYEVKGVAIPTGVSEYLCIWIGHRAKVAISDANIYIWYDDIRVYMPS